MNPFPQFASLAHPVLDVFLVGFICASCLVAALFFLRFWRSTRDKLFMAFTVFFAIEGANEAYVLALPHPNEGSIAVTLIRLLAVLGILGAILWKNVAER
ncbi:MAG TPA: DUF5985 family protein [Terracidiphilus sp.]|jgi:hypothetical protein|nr:DUF5985 family protein [Terracidiphilus sp.]